MACALLLLLLILNCWCLIFLLAVLMRQTSTKVGQRKNKNQKYLIIWSAVTFMVNYHARLRSTNCASFSIQSRHTLTCGTADDVHADSIRGSSVTGWQGCCSAVLILPFLLVLRSSAQGGTKSDAICLIARLFKELRLICVIFGTVRKKQVSK